MADCGCSLKLQKLPEILTDQAIISLSEADAVWDADASDADVRCLDACRSRSRTPRPMAQAPGGRSQTAGPSQQSSRTAPKRRASPVTQESDGDDGDRSPSPASRPNCININNQQASKCTGKARWWVRRSSAKSPAGGRWQYACDVCAEWFQAQKMIDQMEPLRKKDLED